jgi:beta-glucosidase
MKTKKTGIMIFVLSALVIMGSMPGGGKVKKPIYLNTSYSFEERAADLVSRMTPEEKQSQLGNTMPPVPRLGIKAYDVWGEALHGVLGRNNNSGMTATSFPNSVAVGAAWDPELLKHETSVIADEARGFNYDRIFTLTYWSPVVEPARDPRWGRTAETFGEDPYLVSQIASGFVQGLMGDDPTYLKAVPCGKHYFANNTEYNRHTGSADMDDRDIREYYLLPYRTLIKEDRLPAIMTAYSAVNGIPMSASKFYVDSIARKTYGLDGYITGDCGAISDIVSGHHYAEGDAEAAAMGLKSGVDTDCGGVYQTSALDALKKGLITEGDIDKALVDIYTIRMRIGEFDPKSIVPYAGIKPGIINDPSHNDLAVEVATRTPVLLKNDGVGKTGRKALPLNADSIKKIAVLGPQADKVILGDYSGEVEQSLQVTPLAGIRNYIEQNGLDIEVVCSAGGNTDKKNDFFTITGFSTVSKDGSVKEYDATQYDDAAKGLITSERFGQPSVRGIKEGDWTAYHHIDITDLDSIKFNMNVAVNGGLIEVRVGSVTGNVLVSQKVESDLQGRFRFFGRSVIIPAKLNTLGLSGPQNIFLVYHEPESPGTDKETLSMAASADVAVIFAGTDLSTGREESDRFSLALPGNQVDLIKSVAAVNPHTIVVMQTMGMVEVEPFKNDPNVPGILWTGYNGQAQGTAMAKILFGEVNPGGKLNITWYKSVSDLPDFSDYTLRGESGKDGRTYWYFNKDVSYEFGYGLSYTNFEYSNIRISKNHIFPNDQVTIQADVKNTGDADGDEVVQIYVKTPDSPASWQRPIKRLKGFRRVTIPAGQIKTVSIDIDCSDLWFWDPENDRIIFDQGKTVFEIGASSKDIKGQVEANMSGVFIPVLENVTAECGKISFRPGDTAQTSVTASLSDDSFVELSKAKVTYKSNHPEVASVDRNGKVTARKVGTALIFAQVTLNGITVSDSYPMKVVPDLSPKAMTVNGRNIGGLKSEVKAYSSLLQDARKIPLVKAAAAGDDISVGIAQANAVPGTAVVTLTDDMTLEQNVYYINFDVNSVNDEFNGSTPGKQWSWIRENPANWSLSKKPGSLVITSAAGDIVESNNNAENLLLQSANTDWSIESKIVCSRKPAGFAENAGILAYQDDDNFVKLVYRASMRRRGFRFDQTSGPVEQPGSVELIVESYGNEKSLKTLDMDGIIKENNTLILKLEKKGDQYIASCSSDGEKYETVGTADITLKDIRAGLMACKGVVPERMSNFARFMQQNEPDTPFEVEFDYFHIVNSGLE